MSAERPINLKAWEVRAILDVRKTQLRRLVEATVELHPNPDLKGALVLSRGRKQYWVNSQPSHPQHVSKGWPLGQIGDRLWVRETWGSADHYYQDHENDAPSVVAYAADQSAIQFHAKTPRPIPSWDIAQWNWDQMKWKPSIFMPRWASRITLEVVDVRVERLRDITNDDARLEGVSAPPKQQATHVDQFAELWDSINGKRAPWASNPWVWRVEFRKVAT